MDTSHALLVSEALPHAKHAGFILGNNFMDCPQCRVHAHEHIARGSVIYHGYDKPTREVTQKES